MRSAGAAADVCRPGAASSERFTSRSHSSTRTEGKPMSQSASDVLHACETWVCAALACAVLIVVGTRTAQGGVEVWTKHGLYGRGVTALAIDPLTPSTLYAGTQEIGRASCRGRV